MSYHFYRCGHIAADLGELGWSLPVPGYIVDKGGTGSAGTAASISTATLVRDEHRRNGVLAVLQHVLVEAPLDVDSFPCDKSGVEGLDKYRILHQRYTLGREAADDPSIGRALEAGPLGTTHTVRRLPTNARDPYRTPWAGSPTHTQLKFRVLSS